MGRSSDGLRTAVRQLSDGCPTAVGRPSDGRGTAVGRPSDARRTAVRTPVERPFGRQAYGCQTAVQQGQDLKTTGYRINDRPLRPQKTDVQKFFWTSNKTFGRPKFFSILFPFFFPIFFRFFFQFNRNKRFHKDKEAQGPTECAGPGGKIIWKGVPGAPGQEFCAWMLSWEYGSAQFATVNSI